MSSEKMLEVLNIAGYKRQLKVSPGEKTVPISALEGLVKLVGNPHQNNRENSGMRVEIRLVTSLTTEELVKLLTNSKTAEEIIRLLTNSNVDSSLSEKK